MSADPIEPPELPDPAAHVRDLDRADVLDGLMRARRAADREEARLLALAVHWVDLHPVVEGGFPAMLREARPMTDGPARSREERVRQLDAASFDLPTLAGSGTPDVSEEAVAALAAALDLSYGAGLSLVSEAVELCFRLPRLWGLVQAGCLQAWKARQVAKQTMDLSMEAVDFVDRHLAVTGCKNRVPNIRSVVHEARLRCDPDDAAAVEQRALDARGVTLDHRESTATTHVFATLDTVDALDLDASISQLATTMGRLGDDRDLDIRRASALGMLAHPQRALDLLTGEPADARSRGLDRLDQPINGQHPLGDHPLGDRTVGAHPLGDQPAGRGCRGQHAGASLGSRATLYLHVDASDLVRNLADGTGGGTVEKLGAATLDLLRDWLARTDHVTVRPVLDMSRTDGVDAHDPPDWMRELVMLRDPHCVFPGCSLDSRGCDLDHLDPYVPMDDGGPPGQTRPTNLAPLCRRHHRHKTFGRWRYRRLPDDPGPDPGGPSVTYEWTNHNHHTYRVTTRPR